MTPLPTKLIQHRADSQYAPSHPKLTISRHLTLQSAEPLPYNQPIPEPTISRASTLQSADVSTHHLPKIRRTAPGRSPGGLPIVLIHGPRQSGKTTLAQFAYAPASLNWGDESSNLSQGARNRDYEYITFDDDNLLAGALEDPVGFVADLPERVILDEAQRAPQIFTALKLAVDRNRAPGRFILTGSSNVLLLPTLADSLAGRMETVHLHPLAQDEIEAGLPWPGLVRPRLPTHAPGSSTPCSAAGSRSGTPNGWARICASV